MVEVVEVVGCTWGCLGKSPMEIGDQHVMCRRKQGGKSGVSQVGYICLSAGMMIRAQDGVKAFTKAWMFRVRGKRVIIRCGAGQIQ